MPMQPRPMAEILMPLRPSSICFMTALRPRGHDIGLSPLYQDSPNIGRGIGPVEFAGRRSGADEAVDIRRELMGRLPRQIMADLIGVVFVAGGRRRAHAVLLPVEIHSSVVPAGLLEQRYHASLRLAVESGIGASPQYESGDGQHIESLGGGRGYRR